MNSFAQWFARSPLASALRVFAAIVLAAAVADWSTNGSINFGAWQTWVIAGAVSVLPVITRALNPSDPAFGKGSNVTNPFDVWGDE